MEQICQKDIFRLDHLVTDLCSVTFQTGWVTTATHILHCLCPVHAPPVWVPKPPYYTGNQTSGDTLHNLGGTDSDIQMVYADDF